MAPKSKSDDVSTASGEEHADHILRKLETHTERTVDRECCNKRIVCFDMQNVFALPLANMSNFFYKRKLNVYHLTAHLSISKQSYGVLWPETLSGRTGNDIASALVHMLNTIVMDNPGIAEMTLWSNSCVPQNRNKVMAMALMLFVAAESYFESAYTKSVNPVTAKYKKLIISTVRLREYVRFSVH